MKRTSVISEAEEQEMREADKRWDELHPETVARMKADEKAYKERRRREIKEEKAKLAHEQLIYNRAAEMIEEGYRVVARKNPDTAAVKEAHDRLVTLWEENTRSKRSKWNRQTPRLISAS